MSTMGARPPSALRLTATLAVDRLLRVASRERGDGAAAWVLPSSEDR